MIEKHDNLYIFVYLRGRKKVYLPRKYKDGCSINGSRETLAGLYVYVACKNVGF